MRTFDDNPPLFVGNGCAPATALALPAAIAWWAAGGHRINGGFAYGWFISWKSQTHMDDLGYKKFMLQFCLWFYRASPEAWAKWLLMASGFGGCCIIYILYCIILCIIYIYYYIILYYIMLYYIMLCYIYIILYYIILCYIILYYYVIILYDIILLYYIY